MVKPYTPHPAPTKNFLPQTLTITDQGRSVLSVYFELESRADRFFSPVTRVE